MTSKLRSFKLSSFSLESSHSCYWLSTSVSANTLPTVTVVFSLHCLPPVTLIRPRLTPKLPLSASQRLPSHTPRQVLTALPQVI